AMGGSEHANMPGMSDMPAMKTPASAADEHKGHDMAAMGAPAMTSALRAPGTLPEPATHAPGTHGPQNSMVAMMSRSRLEEPGLGLGNDGWRVLRYTDLRALAPRADFRAPQREVEIHLTGNMERFTWGMDGVPFHDASPIEFTHGERLRFTFVNDTMMNHPMHLHGMWMELENGHGDRIPRVHTINVKPAEKVSMLVTADAAGRWAFHCHILYHMEAGMFRVVHVGPAMDHSAHQNHDGDEVHAAGEQLGDAAGAPYEL
ncbi:MAG: multicopper oxidase domain-containing protein, partial [Gemmatimonadota bacterium]